MQTNSVYRLTTSKIVTAGILGAVTIVLSATRLGFIPVPTPAQNATILHVPAIVGGVLEGPLVGAVVGLIFGVYSFTNATIPLFKDPLVAILPRLFIGVVAWLVFAAFRGRSPVLALSLSAALGTATNTVGVLGMAVLRGYMPTEAAVAVGVLHGLPEIAVAILVTLAVVLPWRRLGGTRRTARI